MEGLFSKTFRCGVQPVELAKRLIKEMDAGRTVGVNEVWAPNHFAFSLSPGDHERLEHAETAIAKELGTVIRENASERGWGLVGPPEVTFEVDDRLKKGDFGCDATLVEGEEKVRAGAPRRRRGVVVREDGASARSRCERRHRHDRAPARVRGHGRRPGRVAATRADPPRRTAIATLTDLGSTNGTAVNGHAVQTATLDDGDRITIGTTVLVFRRGAP